MLLGVPPPNCQWSAEPPGPATLAHLASDVHRAEDIAIRRADTLIGPKGDRATYARERTHCMESLFTTIMQTHGTSKSEIGAGAALLIGEQWSTAWELFRVGNGHLGYRTVRIPWMHHRAALFAGGLAIAGLTYRRSSESPQ